MFFDFSLDVGDSMWLFGNFYEITAIEYGDFYGMENLRYFVLDNSFKLIEGIGVEDSGIAHALEYGCLNHPFFETIELIGMNQPLAINDVAFNNITLFPNPVEDILHLETNRIIVTKIEIYDVLGKKLLQKEGNTNQLNISHLPSGILLAEILTDKGVLVEKIVKK